MERKRIVIPTERKRIVIPTERSDEGPLHQEDHDWNGEKIRRQARLRSPSLEMTIDSSSPPLLLSPYVRLRIAIVLTALFVAAPAVAQSPDAALTGIVRDEAGEPLENAIVGLDAGPDALSARTNGQGRFRFARVAAGTHTLRVVWIGYAPETRTVDMGDSRVDVVITLHHVETVLPEVAIRGHRTGIDGAVFSTSELKPLGGAIVRVAGQRITDTTGSDGRFTLTDIRDGPTVVLVSKDNYITTFHTVDVEPDSILQLGFVLDSIHSNAQKRQAIMLREFEERSQWNRNSAVVVPGGPIFDDVLAYDIFDDVRAVLNRHPALLAKNLRVGAPCWFVLRAPPFDPNEEVDLFRIEAVEVYGNGADYTGTLKSRLPPGGQADCADDAIRTAVLERGVNRARLGRLPPEPVIGTGNVGVVVIWLKSFGK